MTLDDDQVDKTIDNIMIHEAGDDSDNIVALDMTTSATDISPFCDRIGKLNLWVGSRKAGRPPECWNAFDAILNVTAQQYAENENRTFYLQLPVQEGKRDKHELERWMPIGLVFLIHHLQQGRRVLVHCAQGKDRSVACVLIFVVLACRLYFPLELKSDFSTWDISSLQEAEDGPHEQQADSNDKEDSSYLNSGLCSSLVRQLLEVHGNEIFLRWLHGQLGREVKNGPLADKEGVRIALHLVRQDREAADPTRSTMQKIHRFLMSSNIYQPR
jgi:tRNA A64-2'-O-ribosylphosphate transferase